MRLERLVIESGIHTVTTEFHPELTVIGGLDASARQALADEIVGSLGAGRPGVHLELHAGGRDLAVFRPAKGRHRVVDTGSVRDVTGAHLGPDGSIDLLAAQGVDHALARRTMRLASADLGGQAPVDATITRLASADQDQLWAAAERLATITGHHAASDEWTAVAGDVPVSFALTHAERIRAAARLRSGVNSLQFLSEAAPTMSEERTAELAHALMGRLEAVRALTPGDDCVPLVVDDPFEGLDTTVKPMLLDLLADAAGTPQLIMLTGDDDVTSWARIEEMTGRLLVVDPTIRQFAAAEATVTA